jgi:hypothetical protein
MDMIWAHSDQCNRSQIKIVCQIMNNHKASDAARPLGPGGAAEDCSASEGTIVDDSAMSPVKIMVPLVGDRVACPICEKRQTHLFFMSLTDRGRHLDQHHLEARIQWGCLNFEKNFPKLHGAKWHLPKCSGTSQNRELPHKCEACPMIFGTPRGLSTHERYAHPALRNMKRRRTDPPPQQLNYGK